MKSLVVSLMLVATLGAVPLNGLAAQDEPTVYVIKKGDTLWGLSQRFLTDPYYWPDLWAHNPAVTNPHFIYPGQKLKVYADHIEIEPATVSAKPADRPAAPESLEDEAPAAAPEKAFTVTGGEGYLMEKGKLPSGYIIATYQDRLTVGDDDVVYTDIGRRFGAKVGDRYSIYSKLDAVSHPVTNEIMGHRVLPLGILQLSELETDSSKAIITKSYREVGVGEFLLPYTDRHRDVALKASGRDLTGYIVATRDNNQTISPGDIIYTDLGRRQGAEAGNMLYVVRDMKPDQKFVDIPVGRLPAEVLGAVVIVDINENSSTALVVKSIDAIYRGDRLEMRNAR
jgi:hypothetical protein